MFEATNRTKGCFFRKLPAMTFSSTHWKNTLDLWTNERRLCLYNLKITWLHCKDMKRQALLPLFVGRCPSRPQKFNIDILDIHNSHIFKGDTCSKTIIFGIHSDKNNFQLHFKIRNKKDRFQSLIFWYSIYVKV